MQNIYLMCAIPWVGLTLYLFVVQRRRLRWSEKAYKLLLDKYAALGATALKEKQQLQAVNAGLHREKADLEIQLDTCLNRGIEQNDAIIKLEKEHSDTKDKLKSAHNHISVLRAEIVKLNRQLNQRKRRG